MVPTALFWTPENLFKTSTPFGVARRRENEKLPEWRCSLFGTDGPLRGIARDCTGALERARGSCCCFPRRGLHLMRGWVLAKAAGALGSTQPSTASRHLGEKSLCRYRVGFEPLLPPHLLPPPPPRTCYSALKMQSSRSSLLKKTFADETPTAVRSVVSTECAAARPRKHPCDVRRCRGVAVFCRGQADFRNEIMWKKAKRRRAGEGDSTSTMLLGSAKKGGTLPPSLPTDTRPPSTPPFLQIQSSCGTQCRSCCLSQQLNPLFMTQQK